MYTCIHIYICTYIYTYKYIYIYRHTAKADQPTAVSGPSAREASPENAETDSTSAFSGQSVRADSPETAEIDPASAVKLVLLCIYLVCYAGFLYVCTQSDVLVCWQTVSNSEG